MSASLAIFMQNNKLKCNKEQFKNIYKLALDKNSALAPVFAKKYKLEDEEEKVEAVILSTASALHWPLTIIKSWRWYNPHETEHQCEWAEDQTSEVCQRADGVRRITHTSHTSHLIIYLLSPDFTERNRTFTDDVSRRKGARDDITMKELHHSHSSHASIKTLRFQIITSS